MRIVKDVVLLKMLMGSVIMLWVTVMVNVHALPVLLNQCVNSHVKTLRNLSVLLIRRMKMDKIKLSQEAADAI